MGETLLRIVGLFKFRMKIVKTDFLYYSAIAAEKKEHRVLFFERNCVEGQFIIFRVTIGFLFGDETVIENDQK